MATDDTSNDSPRDLEQMPAEDGASRPPGVRLPSRPAPRALRQRLAAHSNKLAFAFVAGAILVFAVYANGIHPFADWRTLFWARAWLCVSAFGLASLAIGLAGLERLKLHAGTWVERTSFALAVGVLAFALGIFVAGWFGLLGMPFFFAWPALLILLGRRALLRYFRGLVRLQSRFGSAWFFPQNWLQALAALAIVASAFLLYVQVLSPIAIGFDARMYHLPIAEGYAASGRIRPFPEGWYLGAYPHLGGWLYTWAFLAPGKLEHHLCLAGHLEFTLVLFTMGSVSALASRLIGGARLRYGGAVLFLFPALFNITSSLGLGADHVLAFWAAPLGLALLRYLKQGDVRHGTLLGMFLGAAVLSKYQAVYFIVPITLVLAFDLLRRRHWQALLTAAGVTLLVSSPHWLKNWIAYGDPFYPNLCRWLPDHPLFPGAADLLPRSYWYTGNKPSLSGLERVKDTLSALARYSFFPVGWGGLPEDSAVVGSLFTLLLPVMAWVRPRWRVLLLAACVHVGVVVWWNTFPVERYLQPLVPWMAACVAATLTAAWRTKSVALRAAIVTLVGLQIAWGGDSYLLRSQQSLAGLPLGALNKKEAHPFHRNPYPGQELAEIGERLPKGSRPIAHDFYQSLGVGVPTISDNPDWQGTIDYLQIEPPDEVRRRWLALGGTHLIWPYAKEARSPEDLARDAVFGRASVAFTDSSFDVAGYRVAQLIDRPAPKSMQSRTLLAWLGCGTERELGLYTPPGFSHGTLEKPLSHAELERDASAALAEANALWFYWKCADSKAALEVVSTQFSKVLVTGDDELWVRIPPDAPKK